MPRHLAFLSFALAARVGVFKSHLVSSTTLQATCTAPQTSEIIAGEAALQRDAQRARGLDATLKKDPCAQNM